MADPKDKPEVKEVEKPKRYVVDVHTSLEVLGSTITFRAGQIITNARELSLAREFNVPLRELAPIV
jgi:hypothetical protein